MSSSNNEDDDDTIYIEDEGGYWTGTITCQNEVVMLRESIRRPSVLELQVKYGMAMLTMQERFPKASTHELIRFLKARKFDAEKAADMYEAHLQWRSQNLPIQDEAAVLTRLKSRKFYMLDETDAEGRPILFYCFRRFQAEKYNAEEELKALIYVLEHKILARFGPSMDTQKITVLMDLSGIKSPPLAFLQKVNAVMEANYPETLHRSIMFPVPFWLQRVLSGCLTFVAEETRQKFCYVNDVQSLEKFALMPLESMGADINELIHTKQLRNSKK